MGERMVHSHESAFLLAPLEHWEVHHPKQGKLVLVAQAQLISHLEAELAELLARLHRIITAEDENQVAWLGTEGSLHLLQHLLRVELVHARLHVAIGLYAGINHALGTYLRTLHKLCESIQLLARIGSSSLGADTTDVFSAVEHAKAMTLHNVHEFYKLHVETQVGLIAAVVFHSVCPRHALEWLSEFHAADLLEQVLSHALEELNDILLLYERHLAVYLRELRLAIGTQVFIAEALHYLEVAVEARHHQQLLQGLRALRQGVELAWIHATGHHKVACALWGRAYQHRSLHFEEALAVEILTHLHRHLMAQLQVLAHSRAAQVQIAIFHSQVVATIGIVLYGERRGEGRIQHLELVHDDLDVTRRQVLVLVEALVHCACHLDDKLTS